MLGLAKLADYDAEHWYDLTSRLEENDPTYKQLSDAESDAWKRYSSLHGNLSQGKEKASNAGMIAGGLLGTGAGVGLSVPLRKRFGTTDLGSHPATLGILGGGIGFGTGVSAGENLFDVTHRKQIKERDAAQELYDEASNRISDYAREKGYY